jgi:tetratricopeptide (TPR) repeat protein
MIEHRRNLWRILPLLLLGPALGSCVSLQSNRQAAQETAARLNAAQRDTADELFNAGEYQQAIEAYDRVLAENPQDYYAYGQRGECYRMLSRYDEAIADFTRAIELSPGYARAYFNRGTARARAGDQAGAALDWRAAIEGERDPWARAAMERSAGTESAPAAAVSLAQATTPVPPVAPMPARDMDARSLANRAISREIDGDHPGALADLSAAIVKESDPARRAGMEHLLQLLQSSR